MLNIAYSLKLESLVLAFEKSIFDVKNWNSVYSPNNPGFNKVFLRILVSKLQL